MIANTVMPLQSSRPRDTLECRKMIFNGDGGNIKTLRQIKKKKQLVAATAEQTKISTRAAVTAARNWLCVRGMKATSHNQEDNE